MPSSNALASQHPLFQAIAHASNAEGQSFGITGWLTTIGTWLRSQLDLKALIDTPEERAQIESMAIEAFNAFVGPKIGPFATAAIDGLLTKMLDNLLTSLAA